MKTDEPIMSELPTFPATAMRINEKPMAAPRPRFSRKNGRAYTDPAYERWMDRIAKDIAERYADHEASSRPVAVRLGIKVTKPRHSRLSMPHPDVDNYAKGILDAITRSQVIWVDDSQVEMLIVRKQWADADKGESEGIDVVIYPSELLDTAYENSTLA